MKERHKRKSRGRGFPLIISVIVVFCVLGTVVFSVAQKISGEMSASAIDNLSESLNLLQGTIEAIMNKEAEFQKLIAEELAGMSEPEEFINSYQKNRTIVKVSLIMAGESEGISNTGGVFTEEELDFSAGNTVDGLPVSRSYLNDMGTWAYTMKCPVTDGTRDKGVLYMEYIYDSLEEALPDRFYNSSALLYVMDADSKRLVLKPTGKGERSAGHLDLEDFYRANKIMEEDIQKEVSQSVENGKNVMFYHDIRKRNSLIYMWSVNDGGIYLIGYVPIEAIQQEGRSVNQNIFIVIALTLLAFLICCILYYLNRRQQEKVRKERETEREVHNRQLAEALQAAQIASNSKTMFLSNMSHDIRTPMNAILGFTTLLERDADNAVRVREYTKKITASGQHLLSLINDVLDVSKIESGKVVLTMGKFTLNDLVSSVDTIIRPMAKAKEQHFYISVTDVKHEYLEGDETRLGQVLINLLSNAVKYTQERGSIWFRIIGLKQHSSQYEHIRIEVEDNGYGMTPEFLETIFDAFTRAENSTTNKVQGTGLGMAITKNIVELMGGTIEVESEVDKGSLFRVELELRIPDGTADKCFWEKHGISRILAVDDDEEICRSMQVLMKDTGVRVDTAVSGEMAVRLAGEAAGAGMGYQVVLLDLGLSGMGACETAEKIREKAAEPVTVLFLASFDEEAAVDGLSGMKNTGILSKPFFVSAFRKKILELQSDEEPDAQDHTEQNSIEGLHFLVAEDNEINAEILAELLEMEGASCEILENGKLAAERFQSSAPGEFDALLMDVQMPVMNGYEATRVIRAMDRTDAKEIRIIAMTANAFAEDVKDALDAGMDAHISKPIDMRLLKKTISKR